MVWCLRPPHTFKELRLSFITDNFLWITCFSQMFIVMCPIIVNKVTNTSISRAIVLWKLMCRFPRVGPESLWWGGIFHGSSVTLLRVRLITLFILLYCIYKNFGSASQGLLLGCSKEVWLGTISVGIWECHSECHFQQQYSQSQSFINTGSQIN